ncbi:hypothetical protein EVAR_84441_1 [Eumeta japonica]|uniref:Uncharacterized protein n=1 Tax=Eumeta variegata TaxID=151549 RepID=A0A4C1W278_EUMVA|nr:hypothetical protein EVAR_84441_1 [Eumeta japonica]
MHVDGKQRGMERAGGKLFVILQLRLIDLPAAVLLARRASRSRILHSTPLRTIRFPFSLSRDRVIRATLLAVTRGFIVWLTEKPRERPHRCTLTELTQIMFADYTLKREMYGRILDSNNLWAGVIRTWSTAGVQTAMALAKIVTYPNQLPTQNGRSHAPALSAITVANAFRISVQIAAPLRPATRPAQPIEMICSEPRTLAFPFREIQTRIDLLPPALKGDSSRQQVSPAYPPISLNLFSVLHLLDDAKIAECLADSIESQCFHVSPPHDIAHIQHIEEEVQNKASLEPKDDLPPVSLSEVQTLVTSLKTKKAPDLDCINDVSEQEFLMAPSSLPCCTPRALTVFRLHLQASNSRYSRTIPRFTFLGKFLVGFSPILLASTGAWVCVMHFLPPFRRKREKKHPLLPRMLW